MEESKDKIMRVYPQTGFLWNYYLLHSGGEICPRFHLFSSAAAMGAVINRRVWFQRGSESTFPPLYPNLWIVLVAPQGEGHKSTSLDKSRKHMVGLDPIFQPRILSSKLTPEVLIKTLASQVVSTGQIPRGVNPEFLRESAIAVLLSSELGVLLDKKKYNEGFIPLITDLYDCPDEWSSETIMRGDQRLYNVCLTFMAASTPDWLQSMLPHDAFKGGFMSRLLLVTQPEDWNKLVHNPPKTSKELVAIVLKDLERFAKLRGEMVWSPSAEDFFANWYYQTKQNRKQSGPASAYLERKQNHLLKLAMLLQINDTEDELIIFVEALETALAILDIVEEETLDIIDFIATEPKMRTVQTILATLRKYKLLPESELIRLVWRFMAHPREFDDSIQILMRSKEIKLINSTVNEYKQKETGYEYVRG